MGLSCKIGSFRMRFKNLSNTCWYFLQVFEISGFQADLPCRKLSQDSHFQRAFHVIKKAILEHQKPPCVQGVKWCLHKKRRNGALEKTRTSTSLRKLAPEASASTNSATRAQRPFKSALELVPLRRFVNKTINSQIDGRAPSTQISLRVNE